MKQLTVIVNIKAKAGKVDVVKAELDKLIKASKLEDGCLVYDLHQDNGNPSHFLFFEIWESFNHWEKHKRSQHLKSYMKATDGIVDELTINEMSKIA